jgi:hypothetical protein
LKTIHTYLFIVAVITSFFAGCTSGKDQKKIPDLKETYDKKDKKPFGAYIAYHQLEEMYFKNTIREKRVPFSTTWEESSDTEALYVLICKDLYLNTKETSAMLEFVNKGNDLFISSANIDENLLKKPGLVQHKGFDFYTDFNSMEQTSTNFKTVPYDYYYLPFVKYFSNFENNYLIKPVAYNEKGKANCIVYFYGKGKIFLHSEPRAFSNYFLLQNENYQYLQNILAYARSSPEHLYWDDYYWKLKSRRADNAEGEDTNNPSSLGEIMKHPELKAAFWLIFLLFAIYLLFGGKRRQRIIETIRPNENTTVAFTETIGRLYLQKKDNKNIAEKMSTYFNEYVRNNYYLNTNQVNDDFITTLSRKSGVDKAKVEILYRALGQAHSKAEVSDYELLSLHEQLQYFGK